MEFKYWKLFVLGFGFFGISIIWPLYNAYVPIFLKDFNLSSFMVGVVMTFDNIFAIVMLPLIGAMSDKTRSKFGRRIPYILVGAPIATVFFIMIPFVKNMSILWLMMLAIIFMNFSMALFRAPVVALMPDITPTKHRSQANGIINFMGGLGALFAYFAGKPMYDANPSFPFLVGGFVMLIASFIVAFTVKEPQEYTVVTGEESKKGTAKKGMLDLISNLKDVFLSKEKSLLFMLFSILFWFIGFNAIETFFTSYMKFYVGVGESTGALILGFFSLTLMLFSIPAGFIGSKIGRKKTIIIGLSVILVMSVSTIILGTLIKNRIFDTQAIIAIFFALFAAGGVGWAMVNVNSLPMVVDMTTTDKAGGYTGLYYFFSMAANIIAPPLSGKIIDLFDYNSLMFICLIFFGLAVFTITRVKRGEVQQK